MGGKKKKSTGNVVKRDSKYKIPRFFDCPLCDAKAAIQIKINKVAGKAQVSCRVCDQPKPAFEAEYGRLTQPHDAFFEFYEWLRQKDAEQLEKHNIVVHPTDQTHREAPVQEALEGGSAHDHVAPTTTHDDEIAGLTGADVNDETRW